MKTNLDIAHIAHSKNSSSVRIHRVLLRRGHSVRLIAPTDVRTVVDKRGVSVYAGSQPLKADVVVHGISTDVITVLSALKELERQGIPIVNRAHPVLTAANKFEAGKVLRRADIPHPVTIEVRGRRAIAAVGKQIGFPFVLKAPDGAEGANVTLVHDNDDVEPAMSRIDCSDSTCLVQAFVASARGTDIRVVVIGGRFLAASRRRATNPAEFRSNSHLGGTNEHIELQDHQAQLAERAARALRLDIAGVDLLEDDQDPTGLTISEVNSFPSFVPDEALSGIDIAGAIADVVENRAARRDVLPEVQRLSDYDHDLAFRTYQAMTSTEFVPPDVRDARDATVVPATDLLI